MTDTTTAREDLQQEARQIELKIYEMQERLVQLRTQLAGQTVDDTELLTVAGPRRLSDFFGDNELLILMHNMGTGCSYCTTYADGMNGILDHLRSRAEVLLVSPTEPNAHRAFADSRGWKFQVASLADGTLSDQLGFPPDPAGYPGIAVLAKDATGQITVVCRGDYEPGDRYSPAWHVAALIDGSYEPGWSPRISY